MYKHVSSKDVGFAELHVTLGAGVVLVLGVVPLVLVQALHVLELLAADLAGVRPVHVHVPLEYRRLAELHRTLLTRVHRLAVVVLHRLGVPQRQSTFCSS